MFPTSAVDTMINLKQIIYLHINKSRNDILSKAFAFLFIQSHWIKLNKI